jgi:predicted secreted protein
MLQSIQRSNSESYNYKRLCQQINKKSKKSIKETKTKSTKVPESGIKESCLEPARGDSAL